MIAKDHLKSFVQRIEKLDEELDATNGDKKEVYAEAKSSGFDVKALKEVVRLRRQDPAERAEFEAIVDLYKHALGMIPEDGTPVATRAPARDEDAPHDPETGEITEDQAKGAAHAAPAAPLRATESAGHSADESLAPSKVVSLRRDPVVTDDDLEIPEALRRY